VIGRREFITLLGGAATAWPIAARAQQMDRLRLVTVFTPGNDGDPQTQKARSVFAEALAKAGWTDGRNIRIEPRWGATDDGRIRSIAAELANNQPDVILAFGTQVTVNLKRQINNIPIVFVNAADPVALGFAASFAQPGGNITGFTSLDFSFASKWLTILRDISPGIQTVMVLFTPDNPNLLGYLRTIETGANALRLNFRATPVTTTTNLESDIEAFAREPSPSVIVLPGGRTSDNRETIIALAARYRLPSVYPYSYFAESGGLASYGSDDFELMRRAAEYVDRILRGAKPGDLPVQAPTKFELVINIKTAKTLGIAIPADVLAIADRVIE
jgi:putative tryptophan/tyrosine transport system substrate-binding protein